MTKTDVKVRFSEEADDALLQFAVIIAEHDGKRVFCRHRERDTWEIPGGHRETGEEIARTAARELREETGAADFTLRPVCVYVVKGRNRVNPSGEESFGMLFAAEIRSFSGALHHEIAEIRVQEDLPQKWTYPGIQPLLIREYEKRRDGLAKELTGGR